jgi:hypothetical protein
VVKNVGVVKVRIVVAEVLAAAADAVLVVHYLPKVGAYLVTARPVEEIALCVAKFFAKSTELCFNFVCPRRSQNFVKKL